MTAPPFIDLDYLEQQAAAAEVPAEGQGGRVAGLLAELVGHRVFDLPLDAVRDYPTLEGYVKAAQELMTYYRSPERAAYIQPPDTPPIIGGPVSIEWFRQHVAAPAGSPPLSWLAFLEWILRTAHISPANPGELYSRIEGKTYHLRFRREDGVHPALTWAEPLAPGGQ